MASWLEPVIKKMGFEDFEIRTDITTRHISPDVLKEVSEQAFKTYPDNLPSYHRAIAKAIFYIDDSVFRANAPYVRAVQSLIRDREFDWKREAEYVSDIHQEIQKAIVSLDSWREPETSFSP